MGNGIIACFFLEEWVNRWKLLFTIFAVTFSTMLVEVLLTRVFSVVYFGQFAFPCPQFPGPSPPLFFRRPRPGPDILRFLRTDRPPLFCRSDRGEPRLPGHHPAASPVGTPPHPP